MCWEHLVLGGPPGPLFHTLENCDALFSVKTWCWEQGDARAVAIAYKMTADFNAASREGSATIREIGVDPDFRKFLVTEFCASRAAKFYDAFKKGKAFMCIIKVIPTQWVA